MKTSHKAQQRQNPRNAEWVRAAAAQANPQGNPIERAFAKAVRS